MASESDSNEITETVEDAEEKMSDDDQEGYSQGDMLIGQVFTVPTKTDDGGSRSTNTDGSDAFSRFSNRNIRMRYLLGLEGTDDENQDNQAWMEITGYQGLEQRREDAEPDDNARKTRLSTELHDSIVLLHELMILENLPE